MARITTETRSSGQSLMRSDHASPSAPSSLTRRRPSTEAPYLMSTPSRRQASRSLSRTSRELLLRGKYLLVTCSMPSSNPMSFSSHSLHLSTFQLAMMFFSFRGVDSVTKSSTLAETGRTLQRAPPLIRIFFPASLVRSYTITRLAPDTAAK